MFKGFFISCVMILFEVCDWMNCVLLGVFHRCTSIARASVRRLCCFCWRNDQMFLFHFFAFLWLHFWHFHQGCVYPMRPKWSNHWRTFEVFRSTTWGGRWGTPSHTSGWERRSGKKLHYHCSKPSPLPQGNRRTYTKTRLMFEVALEFNHLLLVPKIIWHVPCD